MSAVPVVRIPLASPLLVLALLVSLAPRAAAQPPGPAGTEAREPASAPQAAEAGRQVDEAAAQRWFERGAAALDAGRFEDALQAFQRCYELAPIERRPYILYNLGVAYDRLRRDEDALDAFQTYLRLAPDGPRAEEARARVRVLQARLQRGQPDGTARHGAQAAANEPLAEAPAPRASRQRGPWLWVAVGGGVAVVGAVLAVVLLSSGGDAAEGADFGGPVLALH